MKFFGYLKKAGFNLFFVLLMLMVFLAWLFPGPGTKESTVPLHAIARYGVSAIFFFYGLRLSPQKLWAGLSNWKLHLLIQGTTFILFPLIAIGIFLLVGNEMSLLWLGFLYLAALPSTVSSSVVMISIAGGNLSAGIFNASISSIIGIFITPLWMNIFITQTEASMDLSHVLVSLSLQVLLPVALGLYLHRYAGAWGQRFGNALRNFDQAVILLIVYTAFCESFAGNMFQGFTAGELLSLSILMLAFFFFMALLMWLSAVMLKVSHEDKITILFCGSKKSLVQGAVMGQVLFTNAVTLGIVLLPIMLYHALQLLAGSVLAQYLAGSRYRKRED